MSAAPKHNLTGQNYFAFLFIFSAYVNSLIPTFIYFFLNYLFGCIGSWLQRTEALLGHVESFVVAHGLSSCGTQAQQLLPVGWLQSTQISVVCMGSQAVAHGLSSCGAWAPEQAESAVRAHRLSCSTTCEIYFLDQGSNPHHLNHWATREVPRFPNLFPQMLSYPKSLTHYT